MKIEKGNIIVFRYNNLPNPQIGHVLYLIRLTHLKIKFENIWSKKCESMITVIPRKDVIEIV